MWEQQQCCASRGRIMKNQEALTKKSDLEMRMFVFGKT